MKSAILIQPGLFSLTEEPAPAGPLQAVVRVRAVGICGTDIHGYRGTFPWMTYPRIVGHEISGEIVEVGQDVDSAFLGKRVAVEPTIACGHCYPCRLGRYNCCVNMQVRGVHVNGGLTEKLAVPIDHLRVLPDAFGFDDGALVEPLAIGCQAVWRGGVEQAETVAIIGAGPIGLSCLLAATEAGASVLVADLLDSRLSLASELGADAVVNTKREDLADAVGRFAGEDKANVVIDAVGLPATLLSAADVVSSAGRLVVLGFGEEPLGIEVPLIIRKELDIRGSRLNTGQFPQAIGIASRRLADVRRLISHRFPLESVGDALELTVQHPELTCKVIVTLD